MKPKESFVGQPIRSLQTMLRVIAEDDPDIPTVIPDGIYGQDTIASVAAFQRKYHLPITGVTDQATWDSIIDIYEPANIRRGKAQPIEVIFEPGQVFTSDEESPYLYLLQAMLAVLAEDDPDMKKPNHNGILDNDTAEALAAFQILAGLPPTGELDRITWKYLVNQFSLLANHRSANGSSKSDTLAQNS